MELKVEASDPANHLSRCLTHNREPLCSVTLFGATLKWGGVPIYKQQVRLKRIDASPARLKTRRTPILKTRPGSIKPPPPPPPRPPPDFAGAPADFDPFGERATSTPENPVLSTRLDRLDPLFSGQEEQEGQEGQECQERRSKTY